MASLEASGVEMLYEHGQRLSEAKDISQHENDYLSILAAARASSKTKQLAAQLIPRYSKHFPGLASHAMDTQLELCEEDELGIRVQAIRGLPFLCKDAPDNTSKIIDLLGQLLVVEESLEKDAIQKALMMVIRQDTKESLTNLFKHFQGSDETVRQRVLTFLKEKVFPLKRELLQGTKTTNKDQSQSQGEMERFVVDSLKKVLPGLTGAEFRVFMDFIKSLSLYGENATVEQVQELLGIVEGQAGLDLQLTAFDPDHIDRILSCFDIALPIYMKGAPIAKLLNYINQQIFPVFEKLPEDSKLHLLKNLSEISWCVTAQDGRQLLPSIFKLLKRYMPIRRTNEELHLLFIECLLYTFHQFAHKVPNATNSLCGYKIVTGQPSDRLGEDFSENFKDWTERLKVVEEIVKAASKKLAQSLGELGKERAAAKDQPAKAAVVSKQQDTFAKQRACTNILTLLKPLHQKAPSFISDKNITLSWKASAVAAPANIGTKRAASAINGTRSEDSKTKKGRLDSARSLTIRGGGRGWRRGRGRGGFGGVRGGRRGFW